MIEAKEVGWMQFIGVWVVLEGSCQQVDSIQEWRGPESGLLSIPED